MNKKYIKCFHCRNPFKNKEEIFRNEKGYPLCEDCLNDELDWEFLDGDAIEYILERLKDTYQQDYKKFKKNIQECSECGTWYDKEELIDGVCDICKEKEIEKELIK